MKQDEGVVARRYATAAMLYLDEHGGHEQFAEELGRLVEAWVKVPMLGTLLTTPVVRPADKLRLVEETARIVGAGETVLRFVNILVAGGRGEFLAAVHRRFGGLLDEKRGRLRGAVDAPVELAPEQQQAVAAALSKLFTREVICSFAVDETLYGGVVARVGNTVVDSSLRGKLAELRRRVQTLSS